MRQGKAELTLRYDASGAILSGTPAQDRVFAHNGEEYTPQTGLTYLRARFYDPAQGRFTTEDVYLGNQIRSLSQNRYAYCENDPVNYADPSGYKRSSGSSGGSSSTSYSYSGGMHTVTTTSGWVGGAMSGGIQTTLTFIASPGVKTVIAASLGGGIGAGSGSVITNSLNNQNKSDGEKMSKDDLWNNALSSGMAAAVTGAFTGGFNVASDMASKTGGLPNAGKELLNQGFGAIEDALSYSGGDAIADGRERRIIGGSHAFGR